MCLTRYAKILSPLGHLDSFLGCKRCFTLSQADLEKQKQQDTHGSCTPAAWCPNSPPSAHHHFSPTGHRYSLLPDAQAMDIPCFQTQRPWHSRCRGMPPLARLPLTTSIPVGSCLHSRPGASPHALTPSPARRRPSSPGAGVTMLPRPCGTLGGTRCLCPDPLGSRRGSEGTPQGTPRRGSWRPWQGTTENAQTRPPAPFPPRRHPARNSKTPLPARARPRQYSPPPSPPRPAASPARRLNPAPVPAAVQPSAAMGCSGHLQPTARSRLPGAQPITAGAERAAAF